MDSLCILLAIMAGIFTTIESSINSQLGKYLTPSVAALHSLIIGLIFMLFFTVSRGDIVQYTKVVNVKPIWLIGGIFGALIIYLSSRSIPMLGISNTLILILAGQLLSGLVLDVVVLNAQISVKKMTGAILFLIGAIIFIRD